MARPIRRSGNLPAQATSFIGRRRELAELRQKLTAARLVSLVGPGGVGKTRLAVRLAAGLRRAFSDGAWLVELAEIQDWALVSNAVGAALDLRDQAATDPLTLLLAYVPDKQLLLVIDNCEHLLQPTAQLVSDILRAAPGVRVIVTSREPLSVSVSGEHVVPVTPLELPSSPATQTLDQLRQNEAVMLFTQRAVAASALALGESGHVAAGVSDGTRTGLLGKRQAEVAELVAEGLSNKQIGARLFISEHTVDSHVRSILNKLGVNSRAQIAGWVAAANQ